MGWGRFAALFPSSSGGLPPASAIHAADPRGPISGRARVPGQTAWSTWIGEGPSRVIVIPSKARVMRSSMPSHFARAA